MPETPGAKARVRQAFHRAAGTYDQAAVVQREICRHLADFAAAHPCARRVDRVLDAGCGTGHALELLAATHPDAELLALDFAPGMLARVTGHPRVCGDLEHLPLATASMDAVWSSLAVQWCRPAAMFAELARVLRPQGIAWIATLGPATLHELRDAFRTVDDAAHVIDFHPPETWQAAAERAGLKVHALRYQACAALAPDLRGLLRHIKAIGAHTVSSAPRAPLGRDAWRRLQARYEIWRRDDGQLPATYDVILLAVERIE